MSVITKGRIFANGEQLTAEKLNVLVDEASFNSSTAVDNSTTRVNASGAITVKPQGITSTELAASSVTKAKIENVDSMKVLGNTSESAAAPQEVAILDEDTMSSDSATSLATQQSIKAYVDDSGITQTTGTAPYYGCRAFASYNGSTQTLNNGSNIASVVKDSTGVYTFNFDVNMPDVNYSVVVGGSCDGLLGSSYISVYQVESKTTSSFKIRAAGGGPSGGDTNQPIVDVAVFR